MIRVETKGPVAVIEIDRQRHRNALDTEHCEQLHHAVGQATDGGARCLVVTGAGSAFCSGADLNQLYGAGFRTALYGLLRRITEVEVPVVAAVNGPAIGAGTQLAIACDLRVAVSSAVFGVPTAKLGLAVDPWTVRRLSMLAGGGPARRMLLACDTFDAAQAQAIGLVDRLGDRDDAIGWATEIAALAPLTHAYNKLVLNALEPGPDPETARSLDAAFQRCWTSEDFAEARLARGEKRPPRFRGR